MIKKYYIIFAILIYFLFTNIAFAVTGEENYNSNYTWEYKDNVLTIVGQEEAMIRPGNDRPWSVYKDDIKKIVLENIDIIHAHNFENYPNLEEVILSKDMAGEIADYAFYNCPKLKHIDLPESGMSRIGKYAFYNTGITEVEIPIFCSWIDEHAFPDNTKIIKKAEKLHIIDAGTAGNLKLIADTTGFPGEGKMSSNTCYNKYHFDFYYDNTAYWILYEDGTLLVYGTDLIPGYTGSRIPWGCYKRKIKKIIINDDKTGTISIDEKYCSNNSKNKLTVYSSKPVEEIMNNRIKKIQGNLMWDCRDDCPQSFLNVDTVVVNRGVEEIFGAFSSNGSQPVDRDIYINKYVKQINDSYFFSTTDPERKITTMHVEVSPQDYINNGYSYKVLPNPSNSSNGLDIINGESFITNPNVYSTSTSGKIVNDIDDYYVSINDSSVPNTIEIEGKTYYKYETYLTNEKGITNISIANDPTVDYYVKGTSSLDKCLKGEIYKLDLTTTNINLEIKNPPTDKDKNNNKNETNIDNPSKENPETKDIAIISVFSLAILSLAIVLTRYRKIIKIK